MWQWHYNKTQHINYTSQKKHSTQNSTNNKLNTTHNERNDSEVKLKDRRSENITIS
jgi:hypothetical protein